MLEAGAPGAERQLAPERDLPVEIGVGRRALYRAIAEAAGNALLLALFDIVDRVSQEPRWREAEAAMRAHLEALEASLRDVEALADAG